MPDFKLKYILANSPWVLDEIGLVDDLHDHSFYQLSTGHPATELDVHPRGLTFFGPIHHEDTKSDEDYLSYVFLNDLDLTRGDTMDLQPALDSSMAGQIATPSIWTEPSGDPIIIEHDNMEWHVPDAIWVYEHIPLDHEIKTVMELRNELEKITGQSVFGIQIPD